jgi:hypothetical protein
MHNCAATKKKTKKYSHRKDEAGRACGFAEEIRVVDMGARRGIPTAAVLGRRPNGRRPDP